MNKFITVHLMRSVSECRGIPDKVVNYAYSNYLLREALAKQKVFPVCMPEARLQINHNRLNVYGSKPLEPIVHISRGTETFYQYEGGIIAIANIDGDVFIGRVN